VFICGIFAFTLFSIINILRSVYCYVSTFSNYITASLPNVVIHLFLILQFQKWKNYGKTTAATDKLLPGPDLPIGYVKA